MSVNFGGVDSGAGETVTDDVGEVPGDAAGDALAVAAPGRAPTRAGDGVCACTTAMQPKPIKRIDLIKELDRIIQDEK